MGGVCLSEPRRNRRQTAIRLFAREYFESTLPDGGEGEYDPRFLITKLGARVNRMMVAGVIEQLERRESERGTMFIGSVKDPTGVHRWNVGSFKPELHPEMDELLARFEGGDRFLMACIGKASHNTTEDGGFFVRMQLEEFAILDRETYARWLVDTADHTMRRIDALNKAQTAEDTTTEKLRHAGVPEDLIDGLGMAMNHYGEWDPEGYKVGVLQALSAAEGRVVSFEEDEAEETTSSDDVAVESEATVSAEKEVVQTETETTNTSDLESIVLEVIQQHAGEEGLDYDSIMKHCATKGLTDESGIEDAIECLRDDKCEIMEPRFGWFKSM